MSHSTKTIKALEGLLAALKEECVGTATAAAARPRGNRTPPVYNYNGGNVVQDVVDVARRAIRLNKTGKTLNAKERNIGRKALKALKATGRYGVLNTNGRDIFTLNGA